MKVYAFIIVLLTSGCSIFSKNTGKEFQAVSSVISALDDPSPQLYTTVLREYQEDEGFSCKQPLYAAYFRRNDVVKKDPETCREKIPFLVQEQYDGARVVWIEPDRVRSVHLLFASKSSSMASRFGHVALRFVICPEPDSSDQDCDMNLEEHLVVGFKAHIDDFSLNTLKALRGKYRAYLFANRFLDAYQQYAIDEFRELYSLPLKLQTIERDELVRGLSEIHWRYSGEYDFFTNNCATLLESALSVIWLEFSNDESLRKTHLRPDQFFATAQESFLTDGEKLNSLIIAERNGFYFSSTRSFYDEAVRSVLKGNKSADFSSLEEYLQISPIQRRNSLERPSHALTLRNNVRVREAQIMLEEYAVLHSERLLMTETAKYFEQQDFLGRTSSIIEALDEEHKQIFLECLIKPLRQRAQPPRRLAGIPEDIDSFADVAQPTQACVSTQGRRMLADTITLIEDKKSLSWQRINKIAQYHAASIDNVIQLKEMR